MLFNSIFSPTEPQVNNSQTYHKKTTKYFK